jgi:hypothetical protein
MIGPSSNQQIWARRRGLAIALVVTFILIELGLRFVLGQATLSVAHPRIEYLFAPNQDNVRFFNRIQINEEGMRSSSFRTPKPADELRILVLGDSVINGGNGTDQKRLATELLEQYLGDSLPRPVEVLNISAGSWGPPNLLAYLEERGTFDADIALLVLSTHDHADAPTFQPLNPNTHPQEQRLLSTWEALNRYGPALLSRITPKKPSPAAEYREADRNQSLNALGQIFVLLKEAGVSSTMILHATQSELTQGSYEPESTYLRDVATRHEVPLAEDLAIFQKAMMNGEPPLGDSIHPTVSGQKLMARIMEVAARKLWHETPYPMKAK